MVNFFNFSTAIKLTSQCVLNELDISKGRGFLPEVDPMIEYDNTEFMKLVEWSKILPLSLKNNNLVKRIDQEFDVDFKMLMDCSNQPLLLRAYSMMVAITHAYIIESGGDRERNTKPVYICEKLSVPLNAISEAIGRLPTQTYETYILQNYKLLDQSQEISLDNVSPLITYTASEGEEWFIKVHVVAEHLAGKVLQQLIDIKDSMDVDLLTDTLNEANEAMLELNQHLKNMNDGLDSEDFYKNIRPYLKAWEPGVIYSASHTYGVEPLIWRGSSGAESSILPAIDRLMGLKISQMETMRDMVNYMPMEHQKFLESLTEIQFELRNIVQDNSMNSKLVESYNNLISSNAEFRKIHYEEIVEKYIVANIISRFINGPEGLIERIQEFKVDEYSWSNEKSVKEILTSLFKFTKSYIVENSSVAVDPKEMSSVLSRVNDKVIKALPDLCEPDYDDMNAFEQGLIQGQCDLILNIIKDESINKEAMNIIAEIGHSNIILSAKTLGTGGTDFTYFLQSNIIQATESDVLSGCMASEKCDL